MSGTDVYYFLQHGKRLERPSRCPSSNYQLMLRCWEWDEKKRPTFFQLVQLLKNDSDYRDPTKPNGNNGLSMSNSITTMPRVRSSKLTTASSSTLTDETNQQRDQNDDKLTTTNHQESNVEQYKSNGNGHIAKTINQIHQSFTKKIEQNLR